MAKFVGEADDPQNNFYPEVEYGGPFIALFVFLYFAVSTKTVTFL